MPVKLMQGVTLASLNRVKLTLRNDRNLPGEMSNNQWACGGLWQIFGLSRGQNKYNSLNCCVT